MKTNYDTPEDREHLEKIFHRAIMATDSFYNMFEITMSSENSIDFFEYIILTLDLRAKIFEYLGYEDYNTAINQQIREKLQHERKTTD